MPADSLEQKLAATAQDSYLAVRIGNFDMGHQMSNTDPASRLDSSADGSSHAEERSVRLRQTAVPPQVVLAVNVVEEPLVDGR